MEKADPFLGDISSACLLTFDTVKSVCEKYGFRLTVHVFDNKFNSIVIIIPSLLLIDYNNKYFAY